jgi:hypothetical protein
MRKFEMKMERKKRELEVWMQAQKAKQEQANAAFREERRKKMEKK